MTQKSTKQQNYSLAPIIEAVIDIRVLPQNDLDFPTLDQEVRKEFLKEFAHVAKQLQNEFLLQSGDNPQATPTTSNVGLRFTSENKREILQIRVNGFTFSKLAPYESWQEFSEKAKYLWALYKKFTSPRQIIRTAVRFINRFDFPSANFEISDYLNVYPQVPEREILKGFSMQTILSQKDIDSTLIISQALVPSLKPNEVSIILDFDLFNETLRSPEDDFWIFLEELRKKKNHFFEISITHKTRELIT